MRSCSEHTRCLAALAALCVACAALVCVAPEARAQAGALATPAAAEPSPGLTWLADLAEATASSRELGRPVLALSVLPRSLWCMAFEQTLSEEHVQKRLARFVLLKVDLAASPSAARQLGFEAAPALVVISSAGVTAARREGFLMADDLAAWLDEALLQVAVADPERMAALGTEDLLRLIARPDPVARELAIQVLSGRRETAARPVVEAFAAGNLATRLGTLELLRLWGAPLGEADPWKPESISPALQGLARWAVDVGAAEPSAPSPEEVERDLLLWITGEEGPQTQSAYERLARVGPALLPRVRELTPPTWNQARTRLTALRYRLLLPWEVALRHPELPFEMAGRDGAARLRALAALSQEAAPPLKGFFTEAFGDPDAKVREAALGGLFRTGEKVAVSQVRALLADPSPDVRATVLKELVRAPMPEALDELAAYAFAERDEDLVVHAARALRELRSDDRALEALVKLTAHKSWRVRAEAVEAFGSVDTSSSAGLGKLTDKQYPAVVKALEGALRDEDVFVVARAVEALRGLYRADLSDCLDELEEVALTHKDLTNDVIYLLSSNSSLSVRSVPVLQRLSKSEDPEVRAAAVAAVFSVTDSGAIAPALAALSDEDSTVRTAAASALDAAVRHERTVSKADRKRMVDALRGLVGAEDIEERFAVLSALAMLGESDLALPGIREIVQEDPGYASAAAGILSELPWPARRELFATLQGANLDAQAWGEALARLLDDAPKEAEGFIWETFENDPYVPAAAGEVLAAIIEFYDVPGGLYYGSPYWDQEERAGARALAARAREHLASPAPARAAMALLLLCKTDRKAGGEEAARLARSAPGEAAPELRAAAAQALMAMGGKEGEAFALEALASGDDEMSRTAFRALLRQYAPLEHPVAIEVGGEAVLAGFLSGPEDTYSEPENRPWSPPVLPEAVTVEMLRPHLADPDPSISLGAAYLMVLLGDSAQLEPLLKAWQAGTDDRGLTSALAQAIAALGRDENVVHLRAVYDSFDPDWERQEYGRRLYWTIRGMKGGEAVALRKVIRQDLGTALFR